jgi:2-phospho-L-lactate guanylyltransferase (CobY/MobA/RfbA family)
MKPAEPAGVVNSLAALAFVRSQDARALLPPQHACRLVAHANELLPVVLAPGNHSGSAALCAAGPSPCPAAWRGESEEMRHFGTEDLCVVYGTCAVVLKFSLRAPAYRVDST